MTKRLLIDATHAEETRVVVLDGNRLEDFDVETSARKQIKGNIYLAKVVRVEPSLQAAFVEYGGNRHGFLAFSEIHPDYYQIPVADRQKLLALQAEAARAEDEDEDEPARPGAVSLIEPPPASGEGDNAAASEPALADQPEMGQLEMAQPDAEQPDQAPAEPPPEMLGGEADGGEEVREPRLLPRFLRQYRIQEVIHRRQILLVQVIKEERGTKGAALTTYISLAGRYCVLMPNSPRGGGVSRKITSLADRRRLKEVIAELEIPDGMGMIVRTAGANRPKPEIKRDCEYLLRLWDEIRETTLASVAPALIYEDASLIKRAIRDVYSRDIEEVIVDGEPAWREAHEFMRMLMPSHARKVVPWQDGGMPLFAKHQIEAQLEAVFSPTVQLRSGGYLVINQTEALVAIDVNSGRSTRERDIEDTALRTNLEAAEEVGRQLRLRDLAGLIVIDFIDMEQRRHNAQVERRLKEALKQDRARIQVGSISHFGLLEMSRQRLRPSLAETSLITCPHCGGLGHVRSTETAAIHALRAIEEEGAKRRAAEIAVHADSPVALYILNHKRERLREIEQRFAMRVSFQIDPSLSGQQVRIERLRAPATGEAAATPLPSVPEPPVAERIPPARARAEPVAHEESDEVRGGDQPVEAAPRPSSEAEEAERKRRRRRRRRGGRRRDEAVAGAIIEAEPELQSAPENTPETGAEATPAPGQEAEASQVMEAPVAALTHDIIAAIDAETAAPNLTAETAAATEEPTAAPPKRPRRATTPRRRKAATEETPLLPELAREGAPQPDIFTPAATPPPPPAPLAADLAAPESVAALPPPVAIEAEPPPSAPRRGWWRR
jgi:ribonuclease E